MIQSIYTLRFKQCLTRVTNHAICHPPRQIGISTKQLTTRLGTVQVATVSNTAAAAAQHQLRDGDTASHLLPSSSPSLPAAADDVSILATDNAGDAEAPVHSPSLLQTQDHADHHARADAGPDPAREGGAGHQPRHQRQGAAADDCQHHRNHNHHYDHDNDNYDHNYHHHYNNNNNNNHNYYNNNNHNQNHLIGR